MSFLVEFLFATGMAKGSGTDDLVSLNERKFILDAIAKDKRVDGRAPFDFRPLRIAFGKGPGRVQLSLGNTKFVPYIFAVAPNELLTNIGLIFPGSLWPPVVKSLLPILTDQRRDFSSLRLNFPQWLHLRSMVEGTSLNKRVWRQLG